MWCASASGLLSRRRGSRRPWSKREAPPSRQARRGRTNGATHSCTLAGGLALGRLSVVAQGRTSIFSYILGLRLHCVFLGTSGGAPGKSSRKRGVLRFHCADTRASRRLSAGGASMLPTCTPAPHQPSEGRPSGREGTGKGEGAANGVADTPSASSRA